MASEITLTESVSYGMVVPSVYGPIIVNRYDTNQTNALIKSGRSVHHTEISDLCSFLRMAPEKAVCLDVGANFGFYALAFARCLAAKNGRVHAYEAQRMLAYMVAGTAALNGVENLFIHHQAVGATPGRIPIPQFDYHKMSSFGSIEFGQAQKEYIGQVPLYQPEKQEYVEVVRLDDLPLDHVYLAKIDIEGMELEALEGTRQLIERDKPLLCIEWYKSDKNSLIDFCKQLGYRVFDWRLDLLCLHRDKQASYQVAFQLPEL